MARRAALALGWACAAGLAAANPQEAASAPAQPGAAAPPLVMVVALNNTLPLVRLEGGRLTGGILFELGSALAERLERPVQFLALPARRTQAALARGDGDLLCYAMPTWIQVPAQWTLPVIPDALLIAAHRDAAPLSELTALRGQRLGTVLGYTYAPLEAALGIGWLREDAPNMEANLRKLSAARMPYAVTEQLAFDYFQRRQPASGLRSERVLERYVAPCALSMRSRLPLEAVNEALRSLQRDGSIERILARYR